MKTAKPQATAGTQMVRLDAQLWGRLSEVASRTGRTPRQEIEQRLRDSLAGAAELPGTNLAPQAVAIGRLMARLASEVITYGEPLKAARMLKESGGKLLEGLNSSGELNDDEKRQAKMFADYLFLKLMNAHERSFREGTPLPLSIEQQELLEIREGIGEWLKLPSTSSHPLPTEKS